MLSESEKDFFAKLERKSLLKKYEKDFTKVFQKMDKDVRKLAKKEKMPKIREIFITPVIDIKVFFERE